MSSRLLRTLRRILSNHPISESENKEKENLRNGLRSKNIDTQIAELRDRCRRSLVGKWCIATSILPLSGGLEINPNNTGYYSDSHRQIYFLWQQTEDFAIEIREVWYVSAGGGEPRFGDPVGSESGEEGWVTVRYDFVPKYYSFGEGPVLMELDREGQPQDSFWEVVTALTGPYPIT